MFRLFSIIQAFMRFFSISLRPLIGQTNSHFGPVLGTQVPSEHCLASAGQAIGEVGVDFGHMSGVSGIRQRGCALRHAGRGRQESCGDISVESRNLKVERI